MVQRLITALVGLPILIGTIWLGFPWLTVLVAVIALLGLWEFYQLWPRNSGTTLLIFGSLCTVLFIINGQLDPQWNRYLAIVIAFVFLVAFSWLLVGRNSENSSFDWAYAIAGPIYVGFLLSHALMLRALVNGDDAGREWLLFVLLVTFATDTGALFTGRTLGRHLLVPSISPRKTWEGATGGFISAIAAALALGALFRLPLDFCEQAISGASIGIVAQLGDLMESRLKRIAGVKDAGKILPGHGGILDRLDSVVFTLPLMYYLVTLVF